MERSVRHALVIAIRPCLSLLFVVCALSCGSRSVKTTTSPMLVDAQGRPSLGYLEHRGEMYELRDWSLAGYDVGGKYDTLAHFAVGPTMAASGGFFSVTLRSHTVHVEMNTPVGMFEGPFEGPEEDQCVEIADLDGPMPAGFRFSIPE